MDIKTILEGLAERDGAILCVLRTGSEDIRKQELVAAAIRKMANEQGAEVIIATTVKVIKEI